MIKVGRAKALARELLKGKYGTLVGAEILMFIIEVLFGVAAAASLIAALLYGAKRSSEGGMAVIITGSCLFTIFLFLFIIFGILMSIGLKKLVLNIATGERYRAGDIFYGLKSGTHAGRVFWIGVILFLIEAGFNILFSILGTMYVRISDPSMGEIAFFAAVAVIFEIILYFIIEGFFAAELLVLEDPSYGVGRALSESRRVMKGAKIKAFWYDKLSFIFWDLLCSFCLPAKLWVTPYKLATKAVLYLGAKKELDRLPIDQNTGKSEEEHPENIQPEALPGEAFVSAGETESVQPEEASTAGTEPAESPVSEEEPLAELLCDELPEEQTEPVHIEEAPEDTEPREEAKGDTASSPEADTPAADKDTGNEDILRK